MAIQTSNSNFSDHSPSWQADGEPGESSAWFLWVQGFKAQSTLQIQVWGRKPATARPWPHHVCIQLWTYMHSVALSQQRSTCVFTIHHCSHICFGQNGFWWKWGIYTAFHFFPLPCLFWALPLTPTGWWEPLWPSSYNLSSVNNF